jgi:hypothetical protein
LLKIGQRIGFGTVLGLRKTHVEKWKSGVGDSVGRVFGDWLRCAVCAVESAFGNSVS